MFSRMKHVKNKNKFITDGDLEQHIRLTTIPLEADIDFLAWQKRSQVAH